MKKRELLHAEELGPQNHLTPLRDSSSSAHANLKRDMKKHMGGRNQLASASYKSPHTYSP